MKKLAYVILIIPILFAFGKNKKPKTSKFLTKHYVEVPEGKVYLHPNSNNYLSLYKGDKSLLDSVEKRNIIMGLDSCSEFYIFKTEVTNENWKEFLYYLKSNGRITEYKENKLDTTVWRSQLAYNEPYVDYYYQHPAYKDYPVVGMTLKQAQAYANWLTEVWTLKKQDVKITFSVPTKKQWIRAARGESSNIYPWGGPYMRNSKGVFLSNHKAVGSENIHLDRSTNRLVVLSSGAFGMKNFITTPGESYYPNQFGIYNMSGNVAELVSDDSVAMGGSWNDTGYDVRIESEQPATKPKSTIGFRVIATIEE
ncbi:MAG: formylglycine-generating enzyme family protein [Bacteroidia bacterium]|nr:formylglycine-generating enzyme family protein [Bacteroidia bacterium]NNJ55502.1 SUMF1/EgtB/PvdO family nonheme iron enzyme [Bacteroidia bacterium]